MFSQSRGIWQEDQNITFNFDKPICTTWWKAIHLDPETHLPATPETGSPSSRPPWRGGGWGGGACLSTSHLGGANEPEDTVCQLAVFKKRERKIWDKSAQLILLNFINYRSPPQKKRVEREARDVFLRKSLHKETWGVGNEIYPPK